MGGPTSPPASAVLAESWHHLETLLFGVAPSATRAAAASHGTRRYNAALKQEEAVIEAAIAA